MKPVSKPTLRHGLAALSVGAALLLSVSLPQGGVYKYASMWHPGLAGEIFVEPAR